MLIRSPSLLIRRSAFGRPSCLVCGKTTWLRVSRCIGKTGRYAMAVDVYENGGEKGGEKPHTPFSVSVLRWILQPLPQPLARLFTNATTRLHSPNCIRSIFHLPLSIIAFARTIIAFVPGSCSRMFFLFVNNCGLNWRISNWRLIDVAGTLHIGL